MKMNNYIYNYTGKEKFYCLINKDISKVVDITESPGYMQKTYKLHKKMEQMFFINKKL